MNVPRPGERFGNAAVVIASCYVTDTSIGLIRLLDHPGMYYEVVEYEWIGGGWKRTWAVSHENIIPAVVEYDHRFAPWGGGTIHDAITALEER